MESLHSAPVEPVRAREGRAAPPPERAVAELNEVAVHALRTPLQAVSLSLAVLARRGALPDADRKTLARAAAGALRAERLAADLLDATRALDGGGLPRSLEPVRLDGVFRAAIDGVLDGKIGPLEVEGDTSLQGDPSRLRHLVSILVGFAAREAPAGALARATVRGDGPAVELALDVDGLRLDAAESASLFSTPCRGGAAPVRGLAPFAARTLAEGHGGEVWAEPTEAGTRLVLRLPRRFPATPR